MDIVIFFWRNRRRRLYDLLHKAPISLVYRAFMYFFFPTSHFAEHVNFYSFYFFSYFIADNRLWEFIFLNKDSLRKLDFTLQRSLKIFYYILGFLIFLINLFIRVPSYFLVFNKEKVHLFYAEDRKKTYMCNFLTCELCKGLLDNNQNGKQEHFCVWQLHRENAIRNRFYEKSTENKEIGHN